jgi:hypothetical protein
VSRAPVLVGALGGLVGLVVAFLLWQAYGRTDVGFGPRGFDVTSDTAVTVEFEVDKAASATALCTVRARERSGEVVGTALVRVGPSEDRRQVVTYPLATTARAATGEVTGCSLERLSSPGNG